MMVVLLYKSVPDKLAFLTDASAVSSLASLVSILSMDGHLIVESVRLSQQRRRKKKKREREREREKATTVNQFEAGSRYCADEGRRMWFSGR